MPKDNLLRKLLIWLKNEKHIIFLGYFLLSLAVMLPLLLSGFVLTLDMVFVPNLPFPDSLNNTWLLEALLWLVNSILPADVIQKLIMFAILFLSGLGMHRLLLTNIPSSQTLPAAYLKWGIYFGGIFYMINPFTYSRFMAGQWLVLLGYALLPFFVRSLLKLTAEPGKNTAIRTALWMSAVVMVSIHQAGMVALLFIIALGVIAWRHWGSPRLIIASKWSAVCIGLALLANSFWLVPTFLGQTEIAQSVDTFDTSHYQAFATDTSGPFGAIGNVLRLQGFWVETRDMYLLPQDRMPLWGLVSVIVWLFVGLGVATAWRTQRLMALFFGITGLLGVILAATPVAALLDGFFSGYREPHKFTVLIVLSYAFFGAQGVVRAALWANTKWGETSRSAVLVGALFVPLLLTPVMLWGFGRQLVPRSYPDDWHVINEQLNQNKPPGRGLFLPWHQYMYFGFAERTIANPAEKFFDTPLVISDDPEFKGISPAYPSSDKRQIEQALQNPTSLAKTLTNLNISFVLLAKELDYEQYSYLDTSPDFRLVYESDTLKYYVNETYLK